MTTSSDDAFARKVARMLDNGAAEVPAGVAYRLREARARALDGQAAGVGATAHVPALAGGLGGTVHGHGGGHGRWASWRLWAGIALIVVAAVGIEQWQAYRQVQQFEDLDAQILSSDLPIDAYLDKGFAAWLATSSDN